MLKILFQTFLFIFPWSLRRPILNCCFGFRIAKGAKVGKSILLCHELEMASGATIGSLTLVKPIDRLVMGENSNLGNLNLITGYSTRLSNFEFFHASPDRKCEMIVGRETGITSRHFFDCNGGIYIGSFCQIAGYGSTFLTHSINVAENCQEALPIRIGNYCFIGIKTTILNDVFIADKSVVAAGAVVTKSLDVPETVYGGIPCRRIKSAEGYKFFTRKEGCVH